MEKRQHRRPHRHKYIQFENEFFIFGWQTGWWLFNLAATTRSFRPSHPALGWSHVPQLVIPSTGMHGLTIISIWSFDCPHLSRELTSIEFMPSEWSNEIWITWKCMLSYIRSAVPIRIPWPLVRMRRLLLNYNLHALFPPLEQQFCGVKLKILCHFRPRNPYRSHTCTHNRKERG